MMIAKADDPASSSLPEAPLIMVESRMISRAEKSISLTQTEMELVVALALGGPCVADAVASTLRPDSSEEQARAFVKVYAHRVRRKAGNDFVRHARGKYRLDESVRVDIVQLEHRLNVMRRSMEQCSSLEGAGLVAEAYRLRRLCREEEARWPWFSVYGERIFRAAWRFTLCAGRAALNVGDPLRAIEIADQLSLEDPCDEEARELAIRSHLRLGEQSAAIREYRRYVCAVREELGADPSAGIGALFGVNLDSNPCRGSLRRDSGASPYFRENG